MRRKIFLLFFTISFNLQCDAQVTWDNNILFDTTGLFYSSAFAQTTHQTLDNGYIISGSIFDMFVTHDFLWVKLDSLGNFVWLHISDGGHISVIRSVVEDPDSNFYLCATAYGYSGDLPVPIVFKSDKNGNLLWKKSFAGNDITASHDIASTFDGGTIVLANSAIQPYSAFYRDIILVKMDSSGNVQWSKSYGDIDREVGYSIIQAADSGFVVSGFTQSFGVYGMLIFRTDSLGNLLWTKVISGLDFYEAISIIQTSDLNFVATGYDLTYGNGAYGSCVIKLDTNGDTIWTETIGNGDTLGLTTVIETGGNDLVLIGMKGTGPVTSRIIKTDTNGQTIWNRSIIYSNYLYPCNLGQETNDRGYIVAGGNNMGFSSSKLDSNGFNNCNFSISLPGVNHPPVQVQSPILNVTIDIISSLGYANFELSHYDSILSMNCISLSIDEDNYSETTISVFPNPANKECTISSRQVANGTLEIYNLLGEKIYTAAYRQHLTMNCEQFTKGIYFIRISNSVKQLTQKLIVE